MIKELNKEELEKRCLHLIGKTFVELGQVKDELEKIQLTGKLSNILINRYPNLSWNAVEQAFEDGILETDDFHLCSKTMYKWLYRIREKIWNGWANLEKGSYHSIDNKTRALLSNQKLIRINV